MYLAAKPNSWAAFCTPVQADWLKDLSLTPPVSVTRPILSAVPPAAAVGAGADVGPAATVVVGADVGAAAIVGAGVGPAAGAHAASTMESKTTRLRTRNIRLRMTFSSLRVNGESEADKLCLIIMQLM